MPASALAGFIARVARLDVLAEMHLVAHATVGAERATLGSVEGVAKPAIELIHLFAQAVKTQQMGATINTVEAPGVDTAVDYFDYFVHWKVLIENSFIIAQK